MTVRGYALLESGHTRRVNANVIATKLWGWICINISPGQCDTDAPIMICPSRWHPRLGPAR